MNQGFGPDYDPSESPLTALQSFDEDEIPPEMWATQCAAMAMWLTRFNRWLCPGYCVLGAWFLYTHAAATDFDRLKALGAVAAAAAFIPVAILIERDCRRICKQHPVFTAFIQIKLGFYLVVCTVVAGLAMEVVHMW